MLATLAQKACEVTRRQQEALDFTLDSPVRSGQELEGVLEGLRGSELSHVGRVEEMLPKAFGELDRTSGIYAKLRQCDVGRRSMAAMVCVIWRQQDCCTSR